MLVFMIVGNYVHVMKINPFSKINYYFWDFSRSMPFSRTFLWKDPKCFTTIYFSTLFSRMEMKMRKPQSNNYLNFQFVYSLLFIAICLSFLLQEARLKELDEEHDLLQSGLQVIEKARKWYFKRITAIQEEKLHLQNQDQYSLEQV